MDGSNLIIQRRYFWTTPEVQIVRERYERLGPQGLLPLLPRRTLSGIYRQGRLLGLKTPRGTWGRGVYQTWESSAHLDEAIRRVYQSKPAQGKITGFAASIGRPRAWVTDRARKLGVCVARFKEPVWTEAELSILENHAHKSHRVIERILAQNGFKRTATSVIIKLKRIGACRQDPDHFTARGLADLFGVDVKSITRWIDKGLLLAKRRGTARTPAQGGDEWWIHRKHVRLFVINNVALVDFRKLDKVWLVDLLAGSVLTRDSAQAIVTGGGDCAAGSGSAEGASRARSRSDAPEPNGAP